MTDQSPHFTVRKRADEALLDSERHLRKVLESMPDAFVSFDSSLRYTYVNQHAERLQAARREDLLGKDVREVYPDPESYKSISQYEKVLAEGAPVSFTSYHRGFDRWVEVRAFPTPDGVSVFYKDVSDKIKTENALRQSREDLDRAQAVGKIGWWRLDTRKNVLSWSAENHRIFGVPEGTPLTYELFLSIVHPKDRQYVEGQWQAGLRGEPYDIEHRIVADGQVKWVREKAYLEFDSEGQLLGGFGITQDITEQKCSQEALRRSERRLSMALSATADAVWEWNLVTGKTYYSPRWYEMLGYDNNEISMDYDGWKSLCHPDDLQPTMDLIQSKLQSGIDSVYSTEFRMRAQDGSWIWILGRGRVVERDATGRPVLLSGTNTDISERKYTELRLRQLSQFPEENPNPVLRISVDSTLLYMNAPARQMLSVMGWRKGRHLPAPLKAALERVREQGHAAENEITLPDGRTFSFFSIRPLDEDYINLYGMDITERKQAEEHEQREHRETVFANRVLRAFVEYEGDALFDQALAVVQDETASRHGVFGYITEPGHLYCPSLSKMLDACEIEGKCIHYPPDKWKGLWARAMKEKRSMYTNQAPPVPPGHPIIHNNLATPILFHGDVIGLLNIANKDGGYTDADRDTLDRLANRIAPVLYAWIQRKLREDERDAARAEVQRIAEQRQLALDAAKLGWWQFDPNTCGAQWDEGYKAIFGVSGYARPNDEILKQIVHSEDLPVLWAEIAAALNPENPRPYATEYRINRPDGQVRWVEDHGIATFEGDGVNRRAVNFVGTVQDVTKRKLAEETLRENEELLRASLFEKEVLLKEIHHRVKNNMQVISSLVDLQANEVQDPAVRIIFQDVVHRVRSMAMVHEKLYQSSDLARVEFADYTETLLGYLWRSQGDGSASGIRLDLDLKPVYLPVNQAVPCGLILNELVNNTLKHAFRGKSAGRVTVRLGEDGAGRVQVEVRDDGVGLPDGLDWRRACSLGLRLVQMLARQLKATVEAIGEEGAVFTITFDKSGS